MAGFVRSSIGRRCRNIWRLDICRARKRFYNGIRKLLPGHTMTIGPDGKPEIQQYWDLDASKPHESRDENHYVQSYRELLEGAVQSHLMSDVPLGCFPERRRGFERGGCADDEDCAANRSKLFPSATPSKLTANCRLRARWPTTLSRSIMKCWSASRIFLARCRI